MSLMPPSTASGPMPICSQAFGSGAADAAPPAPTASANAAVATKPHLLTLLPTSNRVCGRSSTLSIGQLRLFVPVVSPGRSHAHGLVQPRRPFVVSMDTEHALWDPRGMERCEGGQQQCPAQAASTPFRGHGQLAHPADALVGPVLGQRHPGDPVTRPRDEPPPRVERRRLDRPYPPLLPVVVNVA